MAYDFTTIHTVTPTQFNELVATIQHSPGWAAVFMKAITEKYFPGAMEDPEVGPGTIPMVNIKVPKTTYVNWMQSMLDKVPQLRTENMLFMMHVGPSTYDEATLN